jgi:murein DD-endopeptidase MepM/ murein hydrolase activator NlpD
VRRAAVLALVALALLAGTARADVFTVVPTTSTALVPPPPAVPEQLSEAQLLALWQGAAAQYGVPWPVLAAINKVESDFGRNMGPSSAGAVGWMQFMPATWMEYGVDANGDGIADPWNAADAIFSAARYLAANGAATDLYGAVFQYNHADWYVHEVLDIANLYQGNDTVAFTLDKLQRELDEARRTVADAGDALQSADALVARLDARAAGARLLSTRLDLEQRAALAAVRRDDARRALVRARQALQEAQAAAQTASFDPTAGDLLGAPAFHSGYVFPVGGGAGLVSVSHTHHDYPAADIAAPEGEPVYALADALVVNAWTDPDPKCGIGLTLAAFDGQTWTYCHLSVLDPAVVPGAALTAGQQVGLVGHTGDATGPHLHLQLQPAEQWPQQEPWFLSFAGTAFTWQDANEAGDQAPAQTLAAPQAGPVFAVVASDPPSGVVQFSLGNP